MDHLADYNAAKREAFEEAGVTGRIGRTALGRFDYLKRQFDGEIPCRVVVYPLEVIEELKKWPERKERKRRWFSIDDAAWEVDEVGLKDIVRTFGAKLNVSK